MKVSDYVKDKVAALRVQHPGQYTNIACIRGNAMKESQVITRWYGFCLLSLRAHHLLHIKEDVYEPFLKPSIGVMSGVSSISRISSQRDS